MAAFTRTTDGLVTAVSWTPAGHGAVNLATSAAYEPFGPLASLTFGNGLSLTQTWDADYRLTDSKLASGSGSVLDLAPAWQPDGRIASLTDNAGAGRAAAFSYTPSGRVQGASGPWGTGTSAYAYSYDAAGNQTQAGPYGAPIIANVNPANNQITTTTVGGTTQRSLGYTPGGLLTGDTWAGGTSWTFTYNAARRLTQVKASGANSGQYAYDFQGQRVWRLTQAGGGSQTAYVYDEAGHLLAEHSMNSGAMSREYVWLDDQPIATVYLAAGVPTLAYIHTGQIGEPLAMTSASQALLWNGYVDPFGTAGTFSTPTVSLDMRLPGQSYQAEADNFSQNHWRDYDPTLGRYSEPDPLGIDAGQNLYAYVEGDGLNIGDPTGLRKWDMNGIGDTKICAYYDVRARETQDSLCHYYEEAAKICRGLNLPANALLNLGIVDAWIGDSTNASQADIYNRIRAGLIGNDAVDVLRYGPTGLTGADINAYHNATFADVGISPEYYGGNLLPAGLLGNPVPPPPLPSLQYLGPGPH